MAAHQSSEPPKVLSPTKVVHIEKEGEKLPDFYRNLRGRKEEQHKSAGTDPNSGSEDEDSDFLDTDNEVEDGDDDLFVDYVDDDVDDEGVVIKGIKIKRMSNLVINDGREEEESTDDEDLQLPDDDIEGKLT